MSTIVRRVFSTAACTLAEALRHYEPRFGRNELAEANPLTHVAMALAREGTFRVYAQCPLVGGPGDARLDLCAFSPRIGVLVEAKRLHAGQGAEWMANDWARIGKLRLPETHKPCPRPTTTFRCLVATTWRPRIIDWWRARGRAPQPGRKARGWTSLGRILASATRVDALALERPEHVLLYAYAPRLTALGTSA